MNIIDIIIPVYNAPEELAECVESIIRHKDDVPYRIIIINDCSPDPNVKIYLETLKDIEDILILENEVNLGFVGTVNRGMLLSDNDVVLQNSDTVVTENWLKKIYEAAYSHESIATVTPFTNNGTICSIPNFCEDNVIPEGYSVDSFAHFVEHISTKSYPEMPTGVGFCMYIKRKVIQEIGVFDVETFGKGYGEENDFCCRAIEHGYKNILADDTFIYHKGSMSFQGEKAKLINDNLKKLNRRYSYYEQSVHDFIHLYKPLEPIHQNIHLRMIQNKYKDQTKGNALFIMHNFFDHPYNHPVGGTEYHVKDLVEQMVDYNIYILVTNGMELVLKHYRNGSEIIKYRFGLTSPITLTHFHHREYADLFDKILNTFEIDFIHIHHLIKHSFDAPYIAKKNNIPVYFTLHDFYLYCPRINLLDQNNEYCLDNRSIEKCNTCLKSSHHFHTDFLKIWKEQVKEMMKQVDCFFVPSQSTKEIFNVDYPEIQEKLTVIEHGFHWESKITTKKITTKEKVSIGFLGGLSPTKGSNMIYDLITTYKDKNIEWHLIGGIGDQRLNLLNQSNVIKHGTYQREHLSELLDKLNIDIVALLSPWPETYSYTLSESWKHKIPVFVTPMGALKDRVEQTGGGWIAEGTDLNSIKKSLDHLINNLESEMKRVQEKITEMAFLSNADMAESYLSIYQRHPINNTKNSRYTFSDIEVKNAIKYYLPTSDKSIDTSYTNQLEHELYSIKTTIGYKVLERLRRQHNWVLRIGKKAIFMILKYKKRT